MKEHTADEAECLSGAIALLTDRSADASVPLRQYPFHCVPSSGPCRRVIYTTKGDWVLHVADHSLPDTVAIVWRFGPLGPTERSFLQGLVGQLGAPICFVGDLDPLDLATYASLVADSGGLDASYLGVSDTWLEACEADLAKQAGRTLQTLCIPMDDAEREGWTALVGLGVDWPAFVGARAVSMLASGVKFELEAATNPTLYSPGFRRELRHRLFE